MRGWTRRPRTPAEEAVTDGTLREKLIARAIVQPDGCWQWQGATSPSGYGMFTYKGKTAGAHRLMYEELVGPIPPGLEADHLCRNRSCVNPDHLDWVTHAENIRRAQPATGSDNYNGAKAHCPQGHPYAGENLAIYKGRRQCRTCNIERSRLRRLERRSGAA